MLHICILIILSVTYVESLLVVSSVGVQLTTTFATGRQTTRFYDMSDVNAIFINEAVSMVISVVFLYTSVCACRYCEIVSLPKAPKTGCNYLCGINYVLVPQRFVQR